MIGNEKERRGWGEEGRRKCVENGRNRGGGGNKVVRKKGSRM